MMALPNWGIVSPHGSSYEGELVAIKLGTNFADKIIGNAEKLFCLVYILILWFTVQSIMRETLINNEQWIYIYIYIYIHIYIYIKQQFIFCHTRVLGYNLYVKERQA